MLPTLRTKNYQFSPSLIPTIAVLLLFPFLLSLGNWQLNRADEKREIDKGVTEAQNKQVLNLNDAYGSNLLNEIYRPASIMGHYDFKHQFLHDNRTHKGRPGYHVLTPLILANQKEKNKPTTVLINRGWIPYMGTRDNIPDINATETQAEQSITVRGTIKNPSQAILLKDEENLANNHYPQTTQAISLTNFSKKLNYDFLPIVIELDDSETMGFVREWQAYYGSVDKHNAYAVQWFSMAVILLILYFKVNIRRNDKAPINTA